MLVAPCGQGLPCLKLNKLVRGDNNHCRQAAAIGRSSIWLLASRNNSRERLPEHRMAVKSVGRVHNTPPKQMASIHSTVETSSYEKFKGGQ